MPLSNGLGGAINRLAPTPQEWSPPLSNASSGNPSSPNHVRMAGRMSGSARPRVHTTVAPAAQSIGRHRIVFRMSSGVAWPNTPQTSTSSGVSGCHAEQVAALAGTEADDPHRTGARLVQRPDDVPLHREQPAGQVRGRIVVRPVPLKPVPRFVLHAAVIRSAAQRACSMQAAIPSPR